MLLTRGSSLYLKKMMRFLIRLIISVLPIRVIAGGWCYVSKYRWVRAISKYLSQYLSSLLRRLYTFIQHWECLVIIFLSLCSFYSTDILLLSRRIQVCPSDGFGKILPCSYAHHIFFHACNRDILSLPCPCYVYLLSAASSITPPLNPFYIEHVFLL